VRETIPQATTIAQSPSSTTTTLQPVRETIPQATTLAQSPPSTTTTLPPVHETISQTTILAQSPTQQDVHASTVPPVKPSPAPSSTKARDIPAPPKLNVDFNYAVILSRTPKFHCKTWTPRGHFLDKSLDELITELPFDNHQNITGLKVCLEGPWAKVEESLKCNEEAKFEITKGRFLKAVRRCLKNQNKMNPGKTLAMNFEVEALRDDEFEKDEDDDDDDDDINDILF
jgi:hypothetical protein